ncbi:putative Receptor protein kinase [Quillaja saponaria]|uniref:Receptor-like serine/threonine-protein kinase n=1 Tax=Quillaja saponaria TaxID=32244 RepID=A0AAD7L020_QUISA|nr:putative Receptor protein kinase [Quillaja saponaria]
MVAITRKFNDSCILVNKKFVNYVFLFSLACLRLWTTATTLAAVSDSLRSGDVLNFSSSICSPNQKFCMHFNPHGSFLKEHTYLIEYSGNTLVWIANRNKPIVNTSGLVLTLDHSGVMKIMNQGGETITLYSPAQPIRNSVATLLDSGNFILQEVNSNGSMKRLLWQSFDHPTHTLLPGMKLGVNHKTGHSWSLVSWLADNIPASGAFTLEWEPRGSQLLIKQRGTLYWTSGVLRNNKFEQIPKEAQLMFDYIIVSNDNEGYFSYTTRNNYSGWVLDVAGQMSDQGGGDLAKADNCYGYNTDGGCQRWEQPTCRHHGERFEFMSGYFDHETDSDSNTTSDLNSSLTASDCKATCWSNCECVGFVYSFENGTGCAFYNGKWKSVKLASGTPFGILVSSHSDKKVKKKWIWIGSSLATILLIISLCILCLKIKTQSVVLKGKRTKNEMLHLVTSDSYTSVIELENDEKKGHELRVFSYSSIMEATSNLSLENKLGEGGFGPVYKGKFSNGKEVAVKRLSRISGQGVIEFKNELTLISELQHMNLVQLLGCCVHGEEKMLIYEYMSNKSLDCFLFDSNNQSQKLDWKTRFSIIEGIAQGLIYLHKYSRLRVIHRDLKASNILLGENMIPKISDFGMARIFTQQETEANTKRIVGTYGYMSPEYAMEGIFSVKSDVYSFGVLVLEIVSGRRSNGFYHEDGPLNLVGYAWELWSDGLGQELIDQRISSSCINDQMLRCIHVALLCVEESANDRPTMPAVISMLTNESAELPLPKRPAFCTGRKVTDMPTLPIESKDNSMNDLSISDIYVR